MAKKRKKAVKRRARKNPYQASLVGPFKSRSHAKRAAQNLADIHQREIPLKNLKTGRVEMIKPRPRRKANPSRTLKASTGWIKATAVKIVKRGGKTEVLIRKRGKRK